MAREHQSVDTAPAPRRPLPAWDRIKIMVALIALIAFNLLPKINAPFTTFSEALAEMWSETFGRIFLILLPLEALRQVHYLVAERSPRYNTFWSNRFFGGIDRQAQKRLGPWTRYRLARYVKIAVFLFAFGWFIDLMAESINSPIEGITGLPNLIREGIPVILERAILLFFFAGQIIILFWFLSRGGVDIIMPEEIETSYDDVWGQDHVLELVRENVGFLEKPDEIEAKGGYIPGGILLWGPPGTGKTLIAEATAGEVGVPFVFIEPSSFQAMFIGIGPLKVKRLFKKLRKLALRHGGVVAFFDEADSLGNRGSLASGEFGQPMSPLSDACNGIQYISTQSRTHVVESLTAEANPTSEKDPRRGRVTDKLIMGAGGGGGGGMGTLQVMLAEMSGLTKPRGIGNKIRKMLGMKPKLPPKFRIFIMMASNLPEALDSALLRPGRIDRIYRVGYPSREGRKTTLEGYLDKVEHDLTDEQIGDLSVKTPFYSGAKIKDLVNESLILAMRDEREVVTLDDVRKAKRLKELGPPEDTEYIERERHAIAVHEACHAVVGHLVKAHREIDLATIERHSNALGMVSSVAMEDRVTQWRTEYEADIMTSVASLAGEKMFFGGDNSSGVSSDLRTATTLAAYMHGVYGMNDSITSMSAMGQARFGTPDPSPDIIKKQGKRVEQVLQRLYDDTWNLLDQHRDSVLAVAAALEDRKTITGEEIAEIVGIPAGAYTQDRHESWMTVDPGRALQAAGLNGDPAPDEDSPNGHHDSEEDGEIVVDAELEIADD